MTGMRETSKPKFNELTRVQMPLLVYLARIGYRYYGKLKEENLLCEGRASTLILM